MPSVTQGRVVAVGDYPINECIIPMFASTSVDGKRFVKYARTANKEDISIAAYTGAGAAKIVASGPTSRVCAGVTMNEIKYPPDQTTSDDTFQIIDPGPRQAQVSVFTEGIILVEKDGASAFSIGTVVQVGTDGKASHTGNGEKVGYAVNEVSSTDKWVQVKLNLGMPQT